jgi:hypothetical protein
VSLHPDLAAALEALERGFGPLQVLEVHPRPPERRPAPPAPAAPHQPSLFDPDPDPELEPAPTPTADPLSHLSHIPPTR